MFLISPEFYEVRQTEKTGRGVFAKKNIKAGTIIGDYLGKLIDPAEIDANEDTFHRELYYILINNHQAILPDRAEVGVHLINHSCEASLAFLPYDGHVLYVSLRAIHAGEELTVNYLIDPNFGERNFYVCHCGAPTCKGTWYIHPDKITQLEKKFDKSARRQSNAEKNAPVGSTVQPLSKYPESFEDDPFYDLFGADSQKPHMISEVRVPSVQMLRQTIRETGKYISIPAVNLQVRGVIGSLISAQVLQ